MTTTKLLKPLPASSNYSSSTALPAVRVEAAGKTYGTVEALKPLSLTVERGETIALLGPSGSGKTTLLSLIAGEATPTNGAIRFGETELRKLQPGRELAGLVGMIHQQFDLVPHLSALQNVLAGRLGQWSFLRSMVSLVWPQDRELGMAALRRVGVEERYRLRAANLSGGEQQRVAIARMLVQDPRVMLADEPVSSLDPARAEEIISLLVETAREAHKTLIASVHSVELARRYFGRLIGLRNGELQFDLPSERVSDAVLADLYELSGLRAEA
jgi:phosphonate transport system ATP-binding protein